MLRAPNARPEATPTVPALKPRAGCADHCPNRSETRMPLTQQQLQQFAEDGAVTVPPGWLEG